MSSAGSLLLLALMIWVLSVMVRALVSGTSPFKRYERPPSSWVGILVWIPIGYALSRLLGDGAPVQVVVVVSMLLAAVQRIFEGPFHLLIGGAGTLVALNDAVTGASCREPLGAFGLFLLGVFAATGFILIMASGKTTDYLAAGAGVIELVLFAVSPVGGTVIADIGAAALVLPVGAATVAFLIGKQPKLGLGVVGAGVIAGEVVLAAVPGVCERSALTALVGAVVFAVTRWFLSHRSNRQLVGVR
jgi:hypothetical protein